MQMKLKLTVAAALATIAALAAAQDAVVKIGHVAPDVGLRKPTTARTTRTASRMAIEDLNTQGVTIGGKKIKFEIAAEDDAADPKQGTAAAQKLCDSKVAGVVGHLNSGTTIPASKVYNDCGIPARHRRGHQPQPDQARLQDDLSASSPTTTHWAPAWRCMPPTR